MLLWHSSLGSASKGASLHLWLCLSQRVCWWSPTNHTVSCVKYPVAKGVLNLIWDGWCSKPQTYTAMYGVHATLFVSVCYFWHVFVVSPLQFCAYHLQYMEIKGAILGGELCQFYESVASCESSSAKILTQILCTSWKLMPKVCCNLDKLAQLGCITGCSHRSHSNLWPLTSLWTNAVVILDCLNPRTMMLIVIQ